MAGTVAGGRLAAQQNKKKDPDFYKRIGAMGGASSGKGGFAAVRVGADGLTGKQRARIAGQRGGQVSRRK